MKNKCLYITGKTSDGKIVVGGWFYYLTTHGVPLDIIISKIEDKNGIPDWLDFYFIAIREGWHPDRTIGRLRNVIADVYGPDFAEKWLEKFKKCLGEIYE